MITTIYATDEKADTEYEALLDDALIRLRRELRSDLKSISEIDWENESIALKRDFIVMED